MKKIILLLLVVLSVNCYASDHTYDVTGEDENGRALSGSIESNNGEREVTGELEDDDGNAHEFNGQWDGTGQISGETEDGDSVELNTD